LNLNFETSTRIHLDFRWA